MSRRPLDRLHVTPEVAVVLSEITEPTASRPRLQLHREGTVLGDLMAGSELFEQGVERRLERCLHADLLADAKRQVVDGFGGWHCFSPLFGVAGGHGFLDSALCLIRCN